MQPKHTASFLSISRTAHLLWCGAGFCAFLLICTLCSCSSAIGGSTAPSDASASQAQGQALSDIPEASDRTASPSSSTASYSTTAQTDDADAAANTADAVAQAGAEATGQTAPVRKGIVCIDAGHGGIADSTQTPKGPGSSEMQPVEPGGTSGAVTGTPEYVVTLQIALKLQALLEAHGYTVVMCRTANDVVMSSEQRADIANAAGADLFIRLHCNGSTNTAAAGFSTLVPGYNQWTGGIVTSSRAAADAMHPLLIAETGAVDDGIVERTDLAGFNFSTVPTVLFEMGFLTNPSEEALLISDTYQNTLAKALSDGTDAYFATLG